MPRWLVLHDNGGATYAVRRGLLRVRTVAVCIHLQRRLRTGILLPRGVDKCDGCALSRGAVRERAGKQLERVWRPLRRWLLLRRGVVERDRGAVPRRHVRRQRVRHAAVLGLVSCGLLLCAGVRVGDRDALPAGDFRRRHRACDRRVLRAVRPRAVRGRPGGRNERVRGHVRGRILLRGRVIECDRGSLRSGDAGHQHGHDRAELRRPVCARLLL